MSGRSASTSTISRQRRRGVVHPALVVGLEDRPCRDRRSRSSGPNCGSSRWRMVIDPLAGSVSSSEVAPGRRTFRFAKLRNEFLDRVVQPNCPSSNSSSAAQEVISLVLEKTRKIWSVPQRDLRFLVGPPDATDVDEIAADQHRGRNAGEQVAVDVALHGRVRRPEIVAARGHFQVFHCRSLVPRFCRSFSTDDLAGRNIVWTWICVEG